MKFFSYLFCFLAIFSALILPLKGMEMGQGLEVDQRSATQIQEYRPFDGVPAEILLHIFGYYILDPSDNYQNLAANLKTFLILGKRFYAVGRSDAAQQLFYNACKKLLEVCMQRDEEEYSQDHYWAPTAFRNRLLLKEPVVAAKHGIIPIVIKALQQPREKLMRINVRVLAPYGIMRTSIANEMLLMAADAGKEAMVNLLVDNGISFVEGLNAHGNERHQLIYSPINQNHFSIVEKLLTSGAAKVSRMPEAEGKALMQSISPKMLQLLLAHGFPVTIGVLKEAWFHKREKEITDSLIQVLLKEYPDKTCTDCRQRVGDLLDAGHQVTISECCKKSICISCKQQREAKGKSCLGCIKRRTQH